MEKKKATIWNRNFICIMIAASFMNLSHWAVNPLVSKYAQYLGAGPVLMGLLTGMFFAIALAMRPVAGPAMTRLDHKMLLIGVYALGGVVNLGYALFHSIPVFMLLRFFHGVQYSIMGSLCLVIAGDSLPYEKMASGMGVYGVGRDPLPGAGEAHPLLRGGLHADVVHGEAACFRQLFPHGADIGRKLRPLGNDGDIRIHRDIPPLPQNGNDTLQEQNAVRSAVLRIGIGEQLPDVAQGRRPEKRVHQRVDRHVRIRVSNRPERAGDLHAAEDAGLALRNPVRVVTVTDPHFVIPRDRRIASAVSTSVLVVSLMFS